MARSPLPDADPLAMPVVAVLEEEALDPAELALLELELELEPQAAMKAANPVAAAPLPIVLPAILRNRLRSTSSRASCRTTPSWPGSLVGVASFITSPSWGVDGSTASRGALDHRPAPVVTPDAER